MARRPATVDDDIAWFPAEVEPVLQAVRTTVQAAAGAAEEAIRHDVASCSWTAPTSCTTQGGSGTSASTRSRRHGRGRRARTGGGALPQRQGQRALRVAEPIALAPIARIVPALVARRRTPDGA